MRVTANRDVCIGAGLCMVAAPAVFEQDDDGIVVVLAEDVPAEQEAAAIRAVERCPSGALRRVDEATLGDRPSR